MTDYSGAFVVNPQTPQPQSKPSNYNKLLIISGVVALLILLTTAGVYAYKNWPSISGLLRREKPKVVKRGTVDDLVRQTHPNIFQAELAYNTTTGTVTQIATTKINGDIPHFLENPPGAYSGDFVYKVEVVSGQNELIQTGWKTVPQEILVKQGNSIYLKITTIYKPKATVRVYLPGGKLIWTGGM